MRFPGHARAVSHPARPRKVMHTILYTGKAVLGKPHSSAATCLELAQRQDICSWAERSWTVRCSSYAFSLPSEYTELFGSTFFGKGSERREME
jgi:hypothetical protein